MWLNLLVLLMLVLITFFLSMQGLFSAMIVLVVSVISAVVAFGFYENLYTGLLAQWLPAEGQAVSLMALFLVSLLVLRVVLDTAIKGNVQLPHRVNQIGGAAFGFFAAMVMTGTSVTAIQMLPFDREVLGFARHEMAGERLATSSVWFSPDRFAVGLAGTILDGSLSGKAPRTGQFQDVHPDLLAAVDARRSAGVPAIKRANAVSLSVEQAWLPDRVMMSDGRTPVTPGSGKKFVAVQANLGGDLPKAFTPLQMRMVAVQANRVEQYYLRAAGSGGEVPVEVKPLDMYMPTSGTMNLVFEIPDKAAPWYVTFNDEGMGEVTKDKLEEQSAPALSTPAAATPAASEKQEEPAPRPAVRNPAGRTHGADVADQPYVSDAWPEGLAASRNDVQAEVVGSRLKDGHLVLPMSKTITNPAVNMGYVKFFDVPRGMKLVQVPLHRVSAGSLMGQAIDFAVRTLQQQWTLNDDAGGQYMPVGAVAIANVGGEDLLEIQYHSSQENLLAGHTLAKWRRISDADLKNPNAKLYFLYLIPPGKHIVRFDTGRQSADVDLTVQ